MRLMFLGDVVGRSGRDAVYAQLPMLREKLKPDLVVVNGENAAQLRTTFQKSLSQTVAARIIPRQ